MKTRDELLKLDPLDTDYVLGLFSDGHMQYEDVRQDKQTQRQNITIRNTKRENLLKAEAVGQQG